MCFTNMCTNERTALYRLYIMRHLYFSDTPFPPKDVFSCFISSIFLECWLSGYGMQERIYMRVTSVYKKTGYITDVK